MLSMGAVLMPREQIPVTPSVITWARTRAGFTLDDAKRSFRAIDAWEAGTSLPTYPQLESMADKFKVPVAVFFFPDPPDVPPVSESFRTIPTHEFELLPPRIRYLVRKAKVFQLNLNELTGGRNPASRMIVRDFSFRTNVSIAAMAKRVRDYIGVSIEKQTSWTTDDDALKAWRATLHDVGVSVFKDQFRQDGFSGFCLYDDEFPLIYVNNTTSKTRQIFTLFHELAHLLFHTSGIDGLTDDFIDFLPDDSQRIEVVCNRFAAEFLFPQAVFENAFAGLAPSKATAELLAGRFHVSREFVFRRFLDRGLVSQPDYETASAAWAQEKGAGSGGDYYNNVITYLGRDYINFAFSQYYRNRIDDVQLAEYLDVKPRNISTLEEYFFRGAG